MPIILTNVLLSVGFAAVSNFTEVVSIPERFVPHTVADLRRFAIGDPASPVNVFMAHQSGTLFSISDGAVERFEAPWSYSHLQDPALIPRFVGEAQLTTNQIIELATQIVKRLAKGGNPIAGLNPSVSVAHPTRDGEPIPFFTVRWERPGAGLETAVVEIDGRNGRVASVFLFDRAFADPVLKERMEKAFPPDPPAPPQLTIQKPRYFPLPSTNQVLDAIAGWTAFCGKMGINPDEGGALNAVDWDLTWVYTNYAVISGTDRVCHVTFRNGAWFTSLRGVVVSYNTADCYFAGGWWRTDAQERLALGGTVNYRWQDLAKALEKRLAQRLGISAKLFAGWSPFVGIEPGVVGGTTRNRRVLVLWLYSPNDFDRHGMGAEFDTETGEMKEIGLTDPELLRAVARALRRPL